jgi:ERCC4-related helicase
LVCQFKTRLDQLVRSGVAHPKLAALQDVVLRHFGEHAAGAHAHVDTDAAASPSRIIIFTNLRTSVHTICDALRQHEPLVTAK